MAQRTLMLKNKDQKPENSQEVDEIEQRVDALMSVEDSDVAATEPTKIIVDENAPLDWQTAPPLDDSPKKATKITIHDHNSEDLEHKVPVEEKTQSGSSFVEDLDKSKTVEEAEAAANIASDFVAVREELSEPVDPAKLETGKVISESEAIDDIVASEVDAIMDIEDKQRQALNTPRKQQSVFAKLKMFLLSFLLNRRRRALFLSAITVGLLTVFAVPSSRYALLNTVGVRGSSSVKVLDKKTLKPLKNVEVKLGAVVTKTDKDGVAKLQNVKLGPQQLQLKLPAFDIENKQVTIGWGSNPLSDMQLNPRGSHYNFKFDDYLSGKPVKDVEVSVENGESSASSNEKGEASLVIEDTKQEEIKVKVSSEGYRVDTLILDRNDEQIRQHQLVPSKKHAFVSKRSGKYDLYAIAIDGKDESLLLSASGSEKPESLMIVPSLKQNYIAFVTTRDNMRNKEGYLLSSLYVVNVDDKTNKVLTKSERIQVIGWFGSRLVYVKMTEGASAENTDRHKLMSYDLESGNDKELASANYFNDVISANGSIYYAPTSLKLEASSVGFFKINPDGSNKQRLINQETWNIFRQSYDKLTVSLGSNWAEYILKEGKTNRLPGAPATNDSKIYAEYDDKKSVVIDQRDGRGVVLLRENGQDEREVKVGAGIVNPIYWLNNNSFVYRVKNSSETADYAISIDGGEAKKIVNSTNTAGIDRWYYY